MSKEKLQKVLNKLVDLGLAKRETNLLTSIPPQIEVRYSLTEEGKKFLARLDGMPDV